MEINLQSYLRSGKSVVDLQREFGVYSYEHPELPLVGFKYGLIDSKAVKFNPIVRECRGVVLERDSWNIVAFPFTRFFNLGEDCETEARFDWDNFTCQEKLDGSLCIAYFYNGSWHVNTSGSFGKGICYDSGVSWEELFWQTSGLDKEKLHQGTTYIFELWTKYNKIVRSYDKSFAKLIGLRCNTTWQEYGSFICDTEAAYIGVDRPEIYELCLVEQIADFLLEKSRSDPTFEGFVLCDHNFNRIKIKSDSYKQLHTIKGNNNFLYRNIIPQLLKGNLDKLLLAMPEWTDEISSLWDEMNRLRQETDNVWYTYSVVKDRKKFAAAVLREATLPAILFYLKDGRYSDVDDAFAQSEDVLVKYFEGKKQCKTS